MDIERIPVNKLYKILCIECFNSLLKELVKTLKASPQGIQFKVCDHCLKRLQEYKEEE